MTRDLPPKTIGDVFRPAMGGIDLRTFDAAFLESFFPSEAMESRFTPECLFAYADTQGDPSLRAFIADRTGLSAAHILVTDGASQALLLATLTAMGRGDTLFVPRPVFPAYTRMAAIRECDVEYYACDRDGADLRSKLLACPQGRRAGIVINSPHNPTGVELDRDALAEIVSLAGRNGVRILLDDTYQWLTGDIDRLTQLPDLSRDAQGPGSPVAIASLGKFLCLPGLRLGFLATTDMDLLKQMIEAKRHLSHASCHASEQLALSLLTSDVWRRGRARLATELESRRSTFERLAAPYGVNVWSPALGFYTYADNVTPLTDRRVLGVPGEVFESGETEARYCLGASEDSWRKLTCNLSSAVMA